MNKKKEGVSSRRKARIGTMQLLYQMEMSKDYDLNNIKNFIDNFEFQKDEIDYIKRVTAELVKNLDFIDNYIEKNLEGWTLKRLAKVDKQILRVAIYEFLYRNDIPMEVSINEAVDIAKTYSQEESPKFINGILGSIYKDIVNKRENEGN